MEELKMIKKINIDNFTYKGVKKMKINNIGECIISSDNKGNIKLFSFKNIK
jgi:sulfate adenylyltransferase subunit 1 (EFTu-like GTPase family)